EVAEQQFKKLTSSLQRLHEAEQNADQRAQVRQMMKEVPQYLAAFRDAVKAIKEANQLAQDVTTKISPEIAKAMEAVRTSQAGTLTQIQEVGEARIVSSNIIALTASGCALAL